MQTIAHRISQTCLMTHRLVPTISSAPLHIVRLFPTLIHLCFNLCANYTSILTLCEIMEVVVILFRTLVLYKH